MCGPQPRSGEDSAPCRPLNDPSLREWGQGALFPLPPEPAVARVGSTEGQSPYGQGRSPLQVKKSFCPTGRHFSKAEGRSGSCRKR